MTWSGTMTNPPPTPSSPPASAPMPPIARSRRRSETSGSRETADIEVHDLLIIKQIRARALEAVLPARAHVRPLRVSERFPRVLLDDKHGHVRGSDLFDAVPDKPLELRCQTGAGLVEDEHG